MAKSKKKTKVHARPTAREMIIENLTRGKSNAETLEIVLVKHPRTTLGLASINYYRNKLRADGNKIPSDKECRQRAKR